MNTKLVNPILLATFSILLFATMVTFSQSVPIVQAARADAPILQAATPTLAPEPTPALTPPTPSTQYSEESVRMVIFVLLLLAGLFVGLLWWSNKLDQASYLGRVYQDTIEEIEYGRLATTLREKFERGDYYREVTEEGEWLNTHPLPPLPPEMAERGYGYYGSYEVEPDPHWSGYGSATGTNVSGTGGLVASKGGSDKKAEATKFDAILRDFEQKYRTWQNQARLEATKRYRKDLSASRDKAKERAKSAVSVDLSVLRGRGTEFVLEFTTVVVIIFAAVILGMLRILDTQQIGTLLAAIAGYVLGRATTRTQGKAGEVAGTETETRTPVKLTELAELLQVVRGTPPTPPPPPPEQ